MEFWDLNNLICLKNKLTLIQTKGKMLQKVLKKKIKLMSNSVFGKKNGQSKKKINFKLVNNAKDYVRT